MNKSNDEEEEDLYSDLPNFKYDETIDRLQLSNKELQARVAHLEEVIVKQAKELEEYRSQCATLTKNITSLLKTAQNEIKRKDEKIDELNKTVLELKTQLLTSRKRKYNNELCDKGKSTSNEQLSHKLRKVEDATIEPIRAVYTCNSGLPGKMDNEEKSPSVPNQPHFSALPQKSIAPDIKLHTVYSQRMYNKIYNIDDNNGPLPCSNSISETVKIESNNSVVEREEKGNKKIDFEDKNALPKPLVSNSIECQNDNQEHQTNSKHKNASEPINFDKNHKKDYNVIDTKLLFCVFQNEHKLPPNKFQNEHISNNKDGEQTDLNSGTNPLLMNIKEVNTANKILSIARDKCLNITASDKTFKTTDIKENKPVIISRRNRTVNFSKTENISQSLHVKHSSTGSPFSNVINTKKECNIKRLEILNKIKPFGKRNPERLSEKVNSKPIVHETTKKQFTKSHCLRKSKKPIKNVICPIPGQWANSNKTAPLTEVNEENTPNSKTENDKVDIMEALFGSPLKWTENSIDDVKHVEKLSPPANAFEDSCSAHIENVKFKKAENIIADISQTKITELSTKKFSYTERKCYFQPSELEAENVLPSFNSCNKSDIHSSKEVSKQSSNGNWPFRKTCNEIPSKNRAVTSPTFSSFVNTESTSEACDVPSSLKSNPSNMDIVNLPMRFLKSPKYNDSVLGQFDDTTQLISALARDTMKLSPIHTPIKEAKLDNTSNKSSSLQVEKSVLTPLVQSVEDKKNLVTTVPSGLSVNNEKSVPTILLSGEDKNTSVSTTKFVSFDKKHKKQNSLIEKKVSMGVVPTEKKISIPAAVISTVEKKLFAPTTLLSSVQKKFEKKTILLEQPINILCPRKTPRHIGRFKQDATSKKQNETSALIKHERIIQNEPDEIKSPSPMNEKSPITERCTSKNIPSTNYIINHKIDVNNKKSCNADSTIKTRHSSSTVGKNRSSKSPSDKSFTENTKHRSKVIPNITSENRKKMSPKSSSRMDYSPAKEKSRYSSRKENIPRRREHRSPPRMENSHSSVRREKWYRDSKADVFKRPKLRRESFRRPNCHFRQSSVERKIAKDWRHSSKSNHNPIRTIKSSEFPSMPNSGMSRSTYGNKANSKERQTPTSPAQVPIISRSSRISSWSASTGVVSTVNSNVQASSDFSRTSPSQIKWVLRPIDFDKSPSIPTKEADKVLPENNVNLPQSSRLEVVTPVNKPSSSKESSIISPDRCSPAKPIVIVAERRPIKFGFNN